MSRPGKCSPRLALSGLVIACIAAGLFVFRGPLRHRMALANPGSQEAIASAKARGVVARVFQREITRSQLERAVRERLWHEGKTPESLTPERLGTVRRAALDDLIDHELLQAKIMATDPHPEVTGGEIDERLRGLLSRFVSKGEMESAMKSQGIASERELRRRLAARIRQEKYVELKIGPAVKVDDAEARKWFDENRAGLALPERVEARHVFLPALDHPPQEAKAKLEAALADLTSGKMDFATLAAQLSEDPATKDKGGALGWMTRERLPADFAAAVFALPSNKPALVRTRLGWHLVEVTGRKPAGPRAFDDAREEVIAALQAVKRRQAAADFRKALRRTEAAGIEVFHDMLDE